MDPFDSNEVSDVSHVFTKYFQTKKCSPLFLFAAPALHTSVASQDAPAEERAAHLTEREYQRRVRQRRPAKVDISPQSRHQA